MLLTDSSLPGLLSERDSVYPFVRSCMSSLLEITGDGKGMDSGGLLSMLVLELKAAGLPHDLQEHEAKEQLKIVYPQANVEAAKPKVTQRKRKGRTRTTSGSGWVY